MCLIISLLFLGPRLVLLCIALFTNWISMAYMSFLWPVLGWFFMPWTTLAYMGAMINNSGEITGGWLVAMIVAVLFDLGGGSSAASGSNGRRRSSRRH